MQLQHVMRCTLALYITKIFGEAMKNYWHKKAFHNHFDLAS